VTPGLEPVLVATFNPGKAREIARLLGNSGLAFATPAERGLVDPYEETGSTYEENARGKGLHYAGRSGLVAIADDSGIEVDALEGAPGPLSARYGGEDLDDAGRCRLLLRELQGVPEARRGARYVAVAAIVRPDGEVRLFRGVCEGRIADAPRGTGGFGYDPVFFYPPFAETFGQVPEERKNGVSHRGSAFRALAAFLATKDGRRFLATARS
jgi:XTP/dITP diphosphohydrolase